MVSQPADIFGLSARESVAESRLASEALCKSDPAGTSEDPGSPGEEGKFDLPLAKWEGSVLASVPTDPHR